MKPIEEVTSAFVPGERGPYWWRHNDQKNCPHTWVGDQIIHVSNLAPDPKYLMDHSKDIRYAGQRPDPGERRLSWFLENGSFHPTPIQPPQVE